MQHQPLFTRPLVAWLLICAPLIVLFGFVPYTYSHLGAGAELVSVFHALWIMWNNTPDFQHGMLVPPIVAVVIYLRRKQLAEVPVQGWAPAFLLLLLAFAIFWVGRRVDNQYIGFFSIQTVAGSLILWMLGWRWLYALSFPLVFLTFAWPMPFIQTNGLQRIMSAASAFVLNVIGIPAVQDGSGIMSAANPTLGIAMGSLFQVDVAKGCSGIHSLFALMMVSAIYAYFTVKSPWKRAVVFLASIPLAILGNLIRILILTFGVIFLGAPTAIGTEARSSWFHEGAGFAVFIVALGGMLLVQTALSSRGISVLRSWKRSVSSNVALARTEVSPKMEKPADIY